MGYDINKDDGLVVRRCHGSDALSHSNACKSTLSFSAPVFFFSWLCPYFMTRATKKVPLFGLNAPENQRGSSPQPRTNHGPAQCCSYISIRFVVYLGMGLLVALHFHFSLIATFCCVRYCAPQGRIIEKKGRCNTLPYYYLVDWVDY